MNMDATSNSTDYKKPGNHKPWYDPYRYLDSPKPPEGYTSPRKLSAMIVARTVNNGIRQDEAILLAAVMSAGFLQVLYNAAQLAWRIPESQAIFEAMQAAQLRTYTSFGELQQAAESLLASVASGQQITLFLQASASQQQEDRTTGTAYTFTTGPVRVGASQGATTAHADGNTQPSSN